MVELIKNYMGKECIIYTMDAQIRGVIKEIKDGWVLVDNKGNESIVNLDFATHIKEIPKDKKGKNKKVILD